MSDHQLERRPREIAENFCVEPGCEFEGKHAQQGVCYSAENLREQTWMRIAKAGEQTAAELLEIKKAEYGDDPAGWAEWLQAMYECAMMNWASTLDECITLRVENRRLRDRLDGGNSGGNSGGNRSGSTREGSG